MASRAALVERQMARTYYAGERAAKTPAAPSEEPVMQDGLTALRRLASRPRSYPVPGSLLG